MFTISLSITLINKVSSIWHDLRDLKEEPKFQISEPLLRIIFKVIDNKRDIILINFRLFPSSNISFILLLFFSFNK